MSLFRPATLGRCLGAAVVVLTMAAFAASSAFAARVAPDKITTSSSGRCGTVPSVAANDPGHLLRTLPKGYADAYQGFRDYAIEKSAWANWKPKKKSGYNVQVVWVPFTNPLANAALKGLKDKLRASGKVGKIQVQAVNTPTDVPGQLQQLQTAIDRKPDLIVIFPLSGSAVAPLIAKAGKAGVPTVAMSTGIPGKYAVGVNSNLYLADATLAARVVTWMKGKGSVLNVRAIKGVPNDTIGAAAWAKVLTRCPKVKVAGEVQGLFDNTATKAAVQQFLATHPSALQGVFQVGTQGTGVLGAFTQTGRTPPPMADQASSEGTLAYWHNHPKYNLAASLVPTNEFGIAPATVALRILNGDGVKLNTLLTKPYVISTRAQLKGVWSSSYKEGSVVGAPPPRGSYFPKSFMDGFFARG